MDFERKKPEVTTAIILETRVTNKENKHPVKLRVTYQRKRKYYTLKGQHLSEAEFAKVYGDKPRGDTKTKRRKFDAIENRAIHIIDNVLNEFSFDDFKSEYLNNKTKDFTIKSYFDHKQSELNELNKIQTSVLYGATYKSLTEFDDKISFSKINPKYLQKYEKWMLTEKNSYTTIGMYLRNFKHIINRAIKDKVMRTYPFGNDKDKYTIPSGKKTKKTLSINDIEKLFQYRTNNRNMYLAQQYWLFSYLSNGMNMIDIANLKYNNIEGNNLLFIRQKTKDTAKEVPYINVHLLPESWAIINSIGNKDKEPENFIFPIFKHEFNDLDRYKKLKQHIKLTNKYIRKVAKELEINEKITTYWARHSYSTILKRSGAPIEFISEQLGHQNIKVTQNYLDTFENEQREKYSKGLINFETINSEN